MSLTCEQTLNFLKVHALITEVVSSRRVKHKFIVSVCLNNDIFIQMKIQIFALLSFMNEILCFSLGVKTTRIFLRRTICYGKNMLLKSSYTCSHYAVCGKRYDIKITSRLTNKCLRLRKQFELINLLCTSRYNEFVHSSFKF